MTNMEYSIYLTHNSFEIREELQKRGFYICPCCTFKDAKWIHLYYKQDKNILEFHGSGYGCENECPNICFTKCITCSIKESLNSKNVLIFNDIESMCSIIEHIQHTLNNL